MDNQEQKHVRQVHYKRAHPKTYQGKYKELQPEKYKDTVKKVIQKGSTPTRMHTSICVDGILEFLQIQPGQKGLGATLGYGRHTQAMLECLESEGHLSALDVDPVESRKTRERLVKLGYGPETLTTRQMSFAGIDKLVAETGPFDFMMADLDVSSMQTDNPDRGSSYKTEGPLNLRLNPAKGEMVVGRLKTITLEELQEMLLENVNEPYAKEVAREVITTVKCGGHIDTITDLCRVIGETLSFLPSGGMETREAAKESCQRTFQAPRIDVDSEFEVLYDFLEKLPDALTPGGHVVILTFHSGKNRLVKKSFKQFQSAGIHNDIPTDVIRSSVEECNHNPCAHPAKMRWAVKT